MFISRREFLKYCTIAAGAIGLTATDLMKLDKALATTGGLPVNWIAGQACTGCTTSLANSVKDATVQELLLTGDPTLTLDVRVMETLMGAQGENATAQVYTSGTFVLAVEGAIATKTGYCTIGDYSALVGGGTESQMKDVVKALALHTNCAAILGIGTCACYGGVPAARPNPGSSVGVLDFWADDDYFTGLQATALKAKTICIPGCPPNPNWIVGTVAPILLNLDLGNGLVLPNVDNIRRPKEFYGARNCNNCYRYDQAGTRDFINPRKGDEVGDPIKNAPDQEGAASYCLRRVGCKGMRTSSDCPVWKWNSPGYNAAGVNWCVGAGAPCQGCVQKGFPDWFQPIWNLS